MDKNLGKYPFDDAPSKGLRIFLLIFAVFYFVAAPIAMAFIIPINADIHTLFLYNFWWTAIGAIIAAAASMRHLRRSFDRFLDRLLPCLFTILVAYFAANILDILAALIIQATGYLNNGNQEIIETFFDDSYGMMAASTIFLAPIVEELCFRGAIFGALRPKHKAAAYIVSILLFVLLHVWQNAILDPRELIAAIGYIPASLALCWSYDRTGTIWTPIFLHMFMNFVSFQFM